jgi:hypothetical protein
MPNNLGYARDLIHMRITCLLYPLRMKNHTANFKTIKALVFKAIFLYGIMKRIEANTVLRLARDEEDNFSISQNRCTCLLR